MIINTHSILNKLTGYQSYNSCHWVMQTVAVITISTRKEIIDLVSGTNGLYENLIRIRLYGHGVGIGEFY